MSRGAITSNLTHSHAYPMPLSPSSDTLSSPSSGARAATDLQWSAQAYPTRSGTTSALPNSVTYADQSDERNEYAELGKFPGGTTGLPPPAGSFGEPVSKRDLMEIAAALRDASRALEKAVGGRPLTTSSTGGHKLSWDVKAYFAGRYETSSLRKFVKGDGLDPEDTDVTINTLAIVSTLLLTIPFGVITALNYEYWNWLEEVVQQCPETMHVPMRESWMKIWYRIYATLVTTIYCSATAILITVIYFVLRPKDKAGFTEWWKRGRWVLLFVVLATLGAGIAVIVLSGYMTGYFLQSSTHVCTNYSEPTFYSGPNIAGSVTLGVFVLFSFLLML